MSVLLIGISDLVKVYYSRKLQLNQFILISINRIKFIYRKYKNKEAKKILKLKTKPFRINLNIDANLIYKK